MKKLSFLILPAISVIFAVLIIFLIVNGYQFQNIVTLPSVTSQDPTAYTTSQITQDGRININTASCETLTLLKGIGDTLAQRIVAYREEHGPFCQVSDLLKVNGIGETTLNNIIEYIAVE